MDNEQIADIENAILRSSLSVDEIAVAFGISTGRVRKIMDELLTLA